MENVSTAELPVPSQEFESNLSWWQEQLDLAHEDLLAACTLRSSQDTEYSREYLNCSIERCGGFFEELICEISQRQDTDGSFVFAKQIWLQHAGRLVDHLDNLNDCSDITDSSRQLELLEAKIEHWRQTGRHKAQPYENLTAINYSAALKTLIVQSKAENRQPNIESRSGGAGLPRLAAAFCMAGAVVAATTVETGVKKLRLLLPK